MRIVHYQQHFLGADSGTANAARGWAEALARTGTDVVALFDRSIAARPAPRGVEVVGLGHSLRGSLRVPRGISRALEGADVLVLHGGWLLGNVLAARACLLQRVPFVVTTHGVYAPEAFERKPTAKRVWTAAFERPYLRRALAVHVFFDEQVSQVERMGFAVPTIVAPNGIEPPGSDGWDGGSGGYLLWLGRFHTVHKGLDLIVRAVAGIPAADRPEVRLHGPDWQDQKEGVRKLVRELEVERWIKIGDPVHGEEKWELIRRAAGSVYPSRSDACSVAVSESVALGVPTLVAGYPLGNFLAAHDAAVRVEHDARSVADGMALLRSSEGSSVGARGRVVARQYLSWDAVAHSWMVQLDRLMGREDQGIRGVTPRGL